MSVEHPIPTDSRFKNIHGQRFGRWLVIEYHGRVPGHHMWLCRCDCGKEKAINSGNLISGKTTSCGCFRAEELSRTKSTHGMRSKNGERLRHPLYDIWVDMRRRCCDPKCKMYKWYGAKGIRICDRWLYGENSFTGFECFIIDMGERPSTDHSIDRYPANKGNYEPSNCRWATRGEQARNRTDNHLYEFRGQKLVLTDAMKAAGCGLSEGTVRDRLANGWGIDEALTTPALRHRRVAGQPLKFA